MTKCELTPLEPDELMNQAFNSDDWYVTHANRILTSSVLYLIMKVCASPFAPSMSFALTRLSPSGFATRS